MATLRLGQAAAIERILSTIRALQNEARKPRRDQSNTHPRVIVLHAPSGTGKTWVVRQVFDRLREETGDTYWPALAPLAQDEGAAGPLRSRKLIGPPFGEKPPNAEPKFGWWTLNCSQHEEGGARSVTSDLLPQWERHGKAILRGTLGKRLASLTTQEHYLARLGLAFGEEAGDLLLDLLELFPGAGTVLSLTKRAGGGTMTPGNR